MLKSVVLALVLLLPLAAQKRPLTEDDFDSWRHIQNQLLSNDGHYLAYAIFPQQGDGELVVRDLSSGHEMRQPIGELPPPPPPDYSNPQREEAPQQHPGIAIKFTSDGHFLVCTSFAPRDAVEQAKRRHAKSGEMPKGDLIAIDLPAQKVFRAPAVRDFQLPSQAGDTVAYLQLPESTSAVQPSARNHRAEPGSLVVRDLRDGTEKRFASVSEYSFTKDGKTLVYAVSDEDADTAGVYAWSPGSSSAPTVLASGRGAYNKFAWDDGQTLLAFLTDRGDTAAGQVGRSTKAGQVVRKHDYKLYTWNRKDPAAVELVSHSTAGFPEDWTISDKARLTVATGGERVFFGLAPQWKVRAYDKDLPADERVSVDLWSWKDDYIQPMQKIRAGSERFRSYRAVYNFASKRFLQLADRTMNEVLPSDDGRYGIGTDNRAYRRLQDYDGNYTDSYLVDIDTGERRLVARKHLNRLSWSPTSQYAIYFNGKDWLTVSTVTGKSINLTAKLDVSFANEQNDIPGMPSSYRLAGWTKDGTEVLIYDRYDIWRFAPDGSSAVDLTEGFGRKNRLQLRLVNFSIPDDPASRWIDPLRRLLLRVENDQTHDTGFYSARLDAASIPVKLVFAAKNFAPPVKALNANVYVTAASTFHEYPDLLVTDSSFRHFAKVTDADPQMAHLLWGTAELVKYNNLDGIPLQATLYKPDNFDPKKKYPLIVYIYERLTQNVHNFIEPRPYNTINPSFSVSNGYLVLEPDIVYKVGYPGQSALDCVLPAVQAIVNKGIVDEDKIGIQGHSWGGYQIAYMITRTNRFRAAAAGAPVADMISAYNGIRWGPGLPRQFQYEHTQSRIGGSVWEFPLRFIENSPIFAADRVHTPLLMIHNDADDAVPWYQGIEYYLALRRLNKEVYLFDYNGEAHNLRRRANQKDFFNRLEQYFDYYLKGAPEPDWMMHGIPYLDKPGVAFSADDEP